MKDIGAAGEKAHRHHSDALFSSLGVVFAAAPPPLNASSPSCAAFVSQLQQRDHKIGASSDSAFFD